MNHACRYHRLCFGAADPQCRACRNMTLLTPDEQQLFAAIDESLTRYGESQKRVMDLLFTDGTDHKPGPFPMLPELP